MAKQRYVRTTFWTDNYIENLDPSEKLVFLYLLTNEATNLCGIYEISIKRIAFETGYDKEMVEKILQRFTKDEKVFYINGFVCIVNYTKHQSINPSIIDGIKREIEELPKSLTDRIQSDDSLGTGGLTLLYFTLLNFTLPKGNKTPEKTLDKNTDKRKFLDYVYLTNEEYDRLISDYGEKITKTFVDRLNGYIGQIGEKQASKKYVSHNHTIRNWINKDGLKKKITTPPTPPPPTDKEFTPEEVEANKKKLQLIKQGIGFRSIDSYANTTPST